MYAAISRQVSKLEMGKQENEICRSMLEWYFRFEEKAKDEHGNERKKFSFFEQHNIEEEES
jgi:hypothetical protein